jgi:carotenoid cleavage dioxygenase-like enzyme
VIAIIGSIGLWSDFPALASILPTVQAEFMSKPPSKSSLSTPFPASVPLVSREELSIEFNIEGELPSELYGHAFYIGPAGCLSSEKLDGTQIVNPSSNGTPLFNGDAMIYRLDFDQVQTSKTVRLTSAIAKTPCFYTDLATQLEPQYASLRYDNYGLARLSLSLGFRNEVNTAFLGMKFSEAEGERLLITWDAGRPYEIDPVTLEVVTPVGHYKEWREQIALPFFPLGIATTTAHPCFAPYDPHSSDPSRQSTLFTINYGKSIATALSALSIGYEGGLSWTDFERLSNNLNSILNGAVMTLKILEEAEDRLMSLPIPGFLKGELPDSFAPLVQPLLTGASRILQELEARLPWGTVLSDRLKELENQLENKAATEFVDILKALRDLYCFFWKIRALLVAAIKMEDFVYLLSWDGQGELQKWEVVVQDGNEFVPIRIEQSMHQLAVTQDYIVLMDTVFKLGLEQLLTNPLPDAPLVDRWIRDIADFRESPETTIYIIRRGDLDPQVPRVVAKKVIIPRGAAHFLADYDNPDHKITLHLAHNTAWDPSEWIRPYDTARHFSNSSPSRNQGMSVGGMDVNHVGRYEVDGETGKLCESAMLTDFDHTWMTAIYAYYTGDGITPPQKFKHIYWNSWGCWNDLMSDYIYELYAQYPYREAPLRKVLEKTQMGLPVNLICVDVEAMQVIDSYCFPPGYFGNSAQFLPRHPDQRRSHIPESRDGFLISIVNSDAHPLQSQFWIFDAANLHAGPLCKLSHPASKIGMTVHTTWLPKIAKRRANYYVRVEDDYQPRIDALPDFDSNKPLIQEMFEEVYQHFHPPA